MQAARNLSALGPAQGPRDGSEGLPKLAGNSPWEVLVPQPVQLVGWRLETPPWGAFSALPPPPSAETSTQATWINLI